MEIKKVKSCDLKFDKELVSVPPKVSIEVPVIVDRDLNVIFGDNSALMKTEVDVVVVDLPFKETRLAMHSTGRWSEPNWKMLRENDPPKYGYTTFIDGFLFDHVPTQLGVDRHPDKGSDSIGCLF